MNDDRFANLSPLKQALLAIEEMQARVDAAERARTEPIAVIGMSCRFPGGANDPDAYWSLLRSGKDAISEIPPSRWDVDAFYDPDPDTPGKMNSRYGGFLEGVDVDAFDAHFFRIAPREAASLDPQQRLLLEICWEALERAGQTQEMLARSATGVYIGIGMNDHAQFQLRSGEASRIDLYTATGNFLCFAAGRISYLLGLQGPCLVLDTACSASLVALHLACQSLRAGECRMALAGGAQLMLSPEVTLAISRTRALAPDGRCKTFDARADGFVRGEGCGIVVLKRLSDAMAEGDNVLALIRGSAVNHDGPSSGLTVPNGLAQEAVIRQALAVGRVDPAQVSYVEAHGTGTSLGDPIEVRALGAVLGVGRPPHQRFAIGSVKTNFGHLECAAGIAGLIKVVLALRHHEIPPHVHLERLNPHISLEEVPAMIPVTPIPWAASGGRRIAGVSSFGASGTNAHVVLEEFAPPAVERSRVEGLSCVLPLSARSSDGLRALAAQWEEFLHPSLDHKGAVESPEFSFEEICYTAGARRSHHDHRLAFVAASAEEARAHLEAFRTGKEAPGAALGRKPASRPRLAFVFSGQGPQWWGMGRELFESEPVFRKALEACDAALRPHTGWSLLEELTRGEAESRLARTEVAQPALFALQHALVALWRAWGIRPDAVAGHSLGEIAACCAAEALGLDDAAKLVALRGRLMSEAAGKGRMVAVEMAPRALEPLLVKFGAEAAIAAVNGPASTVLSGSLRAMDEVEAALERLDCPHRRLPVDYAFHSPQMRPYGVLLARYLENLSPRRAEIPIFSTVTGEAAADFDAEYWERNVTQTVRFSAAAGALIHAGHTIFLEIGPHPVLGGNIAECLDIVGVQGTVLACLRRGRPERATMLATLARLYSLGFPVEWRGLYGSGSRIVPLPTYPWQRVRYRVERPVHGAPSERSHVRAHPLLGSPLRSPALRGLVFESKIRADNPNFLADHVMHGSVLFPFTGFLEMALAAGGLGVMPGRCEIEDFLIREPLELHESSARTIQLVASPDGGKSVFEIFGRTEDTGGSEVWTLHASGMLRPDSGTGSEIAGEEMLEAVRARCTEEVGDGDFYAGLRNRGINFGPNFRGVERLWRGEGEALARVRLPEPLEAERQRYGAHPVLLDASLQIFEAALRTNPDETFLPLGCERVRLDLPLVSPLWSHCRIRDGGTTGGETRVADIRIFGPSGQTAGEIRGLFIRRAARPEFLRHLHRPQSEWFCEVQWEPAELPELEAEPSPGTWLIFGDSGDVGASLVRQFEERGDTAVIVLPADCYESSGDQHYRIHPERPEHFQQLLRDVLGAGRPACRGIVHLWSLSSRFAQEPRVAALRDDVERSCRSILQLVQRLADIGGFALPRLWLVTRGAQPVDEAPLSMEQTPIWGLGRSVALEHPELWGGLIDLDPAGPRDEARSLFKELCAGNREDLVALRGARRHVARLRRAVLPSPGSGPTVYPDATYLIAGGFGGLGSQVARHLVERGARHLVLAGRSAPSRAGLELQQELEKNGARVHAAQIDIADDAEVARLVASIAGTGPPLRGIVHAAGALADGVLQQLTWDRFREAITSKVEGAWNLHRLTLETPLDFFILFSSAASLLGSPGQAGYSAANAFLDGLAHHRRSLRLPALSVNWGPWEGAGMAAASGEKAARRWAMAGMKKIGVPEGLSALDLLLAAGVTQVGVLPLDWSRYLRQLPAGTPRSFIAALAADSSTDPRELDSRDREELLRSLRQSLPSERREQVVSFVVQQVARVLGLENSAALDPDSPLSSLGLDSLMAVDLRNRIRGGLGVNIQVVKLLEGSGATELATHVFNQWTAASMTAPATASKNAAANSEEVEI